MTIRFNTQYIFSLVVVYMLSFPALLNCGNAILNMIGLHTGMDTVILYGVQMALVLLGLFFVVLRSESFKLDVIILLLFLGGSFLFSWFWFPANASYIFTSLFDLEKNPVYLLFLYAFPCYIFVRQIREYDYFESQMQVFSYIVVTISILVFFFARESSAAQYMTWSYNMLVQLFFLIAHKPSRFRFFHYLLIAAGILVFVLGGARGAALFLILGWMILFVFSRNSIIKNIMFGAVAAVFVGIYFLFQKSLFSFISKVLTMLSIDSRNFDQILQGGFWESEERLFIYGDTLRETGFFGKGIMGDRVHLGTYPHNLFLELLLQYGWVIGLFLCVLLLVLLVKALLKKNRPEFVFIVLLLPCGFFKLMVTGSYLNQEPAFYALLGFCLNAISGGNCDADTDFEYRLCDRQYG